MKFGYGYRCGEVCPRDCPRRAIGCHNAATCPDWAEHEERTKKRRDEVAARGMCRRLSWETRAERQKG